MEETYLYQKVAESIRQKILLGELKSGDRLPTVREMKNHWDCTLGTVQRAYQELARQGLIISRPGQGTRIASHIPFMNDTPLRRANLVNRAENFLLEIITAGYTPEEIEQSVRLALDRFRAFEQHKPDQKPKSVIHFAGSHDLAMCWIASYFKEMSSNNYSLELKFIGSLSGLIALSEGKADLAGCHLWDDESDTYNIPFIRRVLPSTRCAVITLAHRRLGIISASNNPKKINNLYDLTNNNILFVNRQHGSGTRVWLDAMLHRLEISNTSIRGYDNKKLTHSDIARAIAEGEADAGIGLEAAALAYGLNFVMLTKERYDLVIPDSYFNYPSITALVDCLKSDIVRDSIKSLGGYNTDSTGLISWID